jgi:hypothetical protein
MKHSEIDEKFDNGEDVLDYFDVSKAYHPNRQQKPREDQLHLPIPSWMGRSLDREAERIGVSRQALVKMWMAEKLATLPAE